MNKRILAIIGLILLGILLFWGGAVFAQSQWTAPGWQPGWMMGQSNTAQPGPGMMGNWNGMNMGPGMMAGHMMAGHMMTGGMMAGGMMGGNMMAGGMMSNFGGLTGADPLSVEEAEAAISNYLATLENDNLVRGEIMIFENHAYAQILDESTGRGAFEVLVDPVSGNVFPEPGPNMMWNTEYGMMASSGGLGMMGGHMMGNFGYTPDGETNVTAEDAADIAQEYLDASLPGKTADDHADAFPGYYTLHVLEDGEVVGMLSVNAATGQVFLHHWHGDFVEMADADHE